MKFARNQIAQALSSILISTTVLAGCGAHEKGPWQSANFELPKHAGSGTLSVRSAPSVPEYEYRLQIHYGTKDFDVAPHMQSGGSANLRLIWVDSSSSGGPFLIIAHVALRAVPSYDCLDFQTGQFFEGSNPDDLRNALQKAKSGKETMIGNLDGDCTFHTPTPNIPKTSAKHHK